MRWPDPLGLLRNPYTQVLDLGMEIFKCPNPQFLNGIESAFGVMKKAVIHHSDYQSVDEMKSAISQHFRERNEFFKDNPRRAGKKLWETDFFPTPEAFHQVIPGVLMSDFLIDARFLLSKTTASFWGAPLIVVDGEDNSFSFGFMRDLLRLRNLLYISSGAVVFGSDASLFATVRDIHSVVDLCRKLGVVVIEEHMLPAFAIVSTHVNRFSNIVTDDCRMLSFCTDKRAVYLGKDLRSIKRMTSDRVLHRLGFLFSMFQLFSR
jgi:hypothetical protein